MGAFFGIKCPACYLFVVYMQQMLPSLEPYIINRLRYAVYGALT